MPPRFPKPAKEVAVALRAQGIYPKEITRRLNEDQAGLGYAVPVSERTVKDWLSIHKREHGPFAKPAVEDVDADSIVKWKGRAFALICREIHALESKHPGKLSIDQSRLLRQHFDTLDGMERISEKAELRRKHPSRLKGAAADPPPKPRSILDQLREELGAEQSQEPEPDAEQGDDQGAGERAAQLDQNGSRADAATAHDDHPDNRNDLGLPGGGVTEAQETGDSGTGKGREPMPEARIIPLSQRQAAQADRVAS